MPHPASHPAIPAVWKPYVRALRSARIAAVPLTPPPDELRATSFGTLHLAVCCETRTAHDVVKLLPESRINADSTSITYIQWMLEAPRERSQTAAMSTGPCGQDAPGLKVHGVTMSAIVEIGALAKANGGVARSELALPIIERDQAAYRVASRRAMRLGYCGQIY